MIRIKTFDKFFIFLFTTILLLNSQFFLISVIAVKFVSVNSYHNKFLITVLILIIFFVWLIKDFKKIIFTKLDILVFLFILFTFVLLVLQIFTSNEQVVDLVGNYYYNLLFLLYFPLSRFMISKEKNKKIILNIILFIGTFYLLFTIINFLLISKGIIFESMSSTTLIHYVNGELRLPQTSDLIGILFLIGLIKLQEEKLSNRSRMLVWLLLTVSLFVLFYISNVRMVLLTCLILFSYYLLATIVSKLPLLLKICIWGGSIVLGLLLISYFELLKILIGDGQKSASVFYRFEVINYYRSHLFDNVLFGFGFSQDIIRKYSITDIGMIGFSFKYGLVGIIWELTLFIELLIQSLKSKSVSVKLIVIYLMITGVSLSLFDSQRILYLPILLSILNCSIKEKKNVEV